MMKVSGRYFFGHEISAYGLANGYVDYATLAKCFGHVMNNGIVAAVEGAGLGWFEPYGDYDIEDERETAQYFIVDRQGADLLNEVGEPVLYCDQLDMYVWEVRFWGTAWDYVLTDVECNAGVNLRA